MDREVRSHHFCLVPHVKGFNGELLDASLLERLVELPLPLACHDHQHILKFYKKIMILFENTELDSLRVACEKCKESGDWHKNKMFFES